MMIKFFAASVSVVCFLLFMRGQPRRRPVYLLPALLVLAVYYFLRMTYFDGQYPKRLLYTVMLFILSLFLYQTSWKESLFNAAFCAFVVPALNLTTVIPFPESWITGAYSSLRILLTGGFQILCAVLWDVLGGNKNDKRCSRATWAVFLLVLLSSNVHIVRTIQPDRALSAGTRLYFLWDIAEVELLGIYLFVSSYVFNREAVIRREEFLLREKLVLDAKAEQNNEIRRMAHDLRYRLSAIESSEPGSTEEIVRRMQDEIDSYEPLPESGNRMLDVILNEKMRECRKENIHFLVEENVISASFIEPQDLSVLLGNALENAKEAVLKLPPERREICVKIHETEMLMILCVENTWDGQLQWNGNGLKTTKKDSLNHGIGIESMRKITAKYAGTMQMKTDSALFELKIVLPKQDSAAV